MTRPQHIPDGWPAVIPRIFVDTPEPLVAFIKRVFGATGDFHRERPSELRIGASMVLVSASTDRGAFPAFLYVYVEENAAAYRRGLEDGDTSVEAPQDLPSEKRRNLVQERSHHPTQSAPHGGHL